MIEIEETSDDCFTVLLAPPDSLWLSQVVKATHIDRMSILGRAINIGLTSLMQDTKDVRRVQRERITISVEGKKDDSSNKGTG